MCPQVYIKYTETKAFSKYFDVSNVIYKIKVTLTIYGYNVCISTVFNTLLSTDIYTLSFMCLFKCHKMQVQHILRETDLSN